MNIDNSVSVFQKILFFAMIIITLSGLPADLFAGTKDGGGGFVVTCPSGAPYRTPLLLDLHEVWNDQPEFQFQRTEATGDPVKDSQLLRAELAKILNSDFLKYPEYASFRRMLIYNVRVVLKSIEQTLGNTKYYLSGKDKPATYLFTQSDIGRKKPIEIPEGCVPEPVAYMDSVARVHLTKAIWLRLDITDRAALIIHEAVYAIRRFLFDEQSSDISREHTAKVILEAQPEVQATHMSIFESPEAQQGWFDYQRVWYFSGMFNVEAHLTQGKSAKIEIFNQNKKLGEISLNEKNKIVGSLGASGERLIARGDSLRMTIRGDKNSVVEVAIKDGENNPEDPFYGGAWNGIVDQFKISTDGLPMGIYDFMLITPSADFIPVAKEPAKVWIRDFN